MTDPLNLSFRRSEGLGIAVTGGVVAVVIGGVIAVFLRKPGLIPGVTWPFPMLVAIATVGFLAVFFLQKGRDGRARILALVAGAAGGGAVVAAFPGINAFPDQLTYGIVGFFASSLTLQRVALNQADRERVEVIDQFLLGEHRMPADRRTPILALGSLVHFAYDLRTPQLAALYLNEQFYGTAQVPMLDGYPAVRRLRLPFRDTRFPLTTMEEWRSAAIITHARAAENPRALKAALRAVSLVTRPLGLTTKVIEAAGYEKGLELLQSEMPDEYLNALTV